MASDFKAISKQRFATQPSHIGDQITEFEITKSALVEAEKGRTTKRKKDKIQRRLVIGFDTEYVAHEAVDKDEIKDPSASIHNKVLSYQYSVSVVEAGSEKPVHQTEGIIVPKEDELITFSDFIAFAMGDLINKNPSVTLPKNVYVVGHFTRADLPGFSGFIDLTRSSLQNLRNTFVNVKNYIQLRVLSETEQTELGTFNIVLRDTVLLAPANAKKLADVGKIVGFDKQLLGETPEEDVEIKTTGMGKLRDTKWEVFRSYAIRDAEICVRYAEKLLHMQQSITGKLELPPTLSSFGIEKVQLDWKEKGWSKDDVLGQESIKTKKYNKRTNKFTFGTETPLIAAIHLEEPLAIESYHGGRNEQFVFGIAPKGEWRDHDLSSAYTTAMSLIGFPRWEEIKTIKSTKNLKLTDLAFFWVDFEFPEEVRFPTLPVRCDSGIIFPRKGRSHCATPEILLAKKLGAKITIKKAVFIPSDYENPIFRDFIIDCINR